MRGQIFLITIFVATASMAQVAPSATGGMPATQMETPPPVSGTGYPTTIGVEARSNYLRGGITYSTAYIDNLYAGADNTAIAETTLSILPTVAFDVTTARQQAVMTYSSGFTIYRPSSTLNEVDNTAMVNYGLRLTPHTMISAMEKFEDSSSPFVPSDGELSGVVLGQPISSTPGVIPPFAKHVENSANAEITEQTGLNTMIGASGLSTELRYPNSSQTPGLSNSSSRGGMAFYSHRISPSQYVGAAYLYLDMLTYPVNAVSSTTTSTPMGYYTAYLKPRLSLSVSGGPQYYRVAETPLPTLSSWALLLSASMGWQGERTSFAADYSQSVTGGGGIAGAYHSKNAAITGRWMLARTWTAGVSGAYSINKTVSEILSPGAQNGHAISGSATLQHSLWRQMSMAFNYDRIHQSYSGIAAISANPDSDRESISITWNFLHPLGR